MSLPGLVIPDLEFHEQGHIYLLDGHRIPSVNTILDAMNKDWQTPWALKKAREHLLGHFDGRATYNKEEAATIIEASLKAHEEDAADAAKVGKAAHNWIKSYIEFRGMAGMCVTPRFDGLSKRSTEAVQEFLQWEKTRHVEYLASELMMASRKYWFSGTPDTIARVDGQTAIIDFKTSAGIRKTNFLQTTGYQIIWEECDVEHRYPISKRIILLLPKTGAAFQIHEVPTPYAKDREAFLALRQVWQWLDDVKPFFPKWS